MWHDIQGCAVRLRLTSYMLTHPLLAQNLALDPPLALINDMAGNTDESSGAYTAAHLAVSTSELCLPVLVCLQDYGAEFSPRPQHRSQACTSRQVLSLVLICLNLCGIQLDGDQTNCESTYPALSPVS